MLALRSRKLHELKGSMAPCACGGENEVRKGPATVDKTWIAQLHLCSPRGPVPKACERRLVSAKRGAQASHPMRAARNSQPPPAWLSR